MKADLQNPVFMIRVLLAGIGLFVLVASSGDGFIGSSAQAAGESPRDVLAAQIRMQGVACDRPLSAVRDARRSRPDYAVWVLKCSNAIYRISRAPDMAAKIEQLQ